MLTDNQTFRIRNPGWVQKKCGKGADFRTLNRGLALRQCTNRAWSYGIIWQSIATVQFSSGAQSCLTVCDPPWTAAHQASLSITNFQSLCKVMSIESVMPSNHLILCHPLLLLPSIFPSIRVFSNESALRIRWPKYWSFSFNISPSNEHPRLTSFKMNWLDLLAVQGSLKSLLQHHSSKASILWCSAFFIVQLSHPYMTTGITIALTRQTGICYFPQYYRSDTKHLSIIWICFTDHLPKPNPQNCLRVRFLESENKSHTGTSPFLS